jgi:hypothetical protein
MACHFLQPVIYDARAPSEAWCILQGERPCRGRTNHPPVSSVAPTAELKLVNFYNVNKVGEAYTENCAGRRGPVAPESWYSFEIKLEIAEGFNVHRRQYRSIRHGKDVEGLRSQQAVACTKRCIQELGRSIKSLTGGTIR